MRGGQGPEDRRDEYGAGTVKTAKEQVSQPKLGFTGWARWAWRQLTTMRVALFLLLLLALGAIPASVFPQRIQDPTAVSDYISAHGELGRIMDTLQLFDVNSSVWFSAIYILLLVSLVGCILPRTKVHWRAMRQAPPKAPRRLERMPAYRTYDTSGDESTLLADSAHVLKRRRYRVTSRGDHIAAERGYLKETGNLVFHIAVLGVVVCAAIGGLLSYSGQRILVEGDTFNDSLVDYDSFTKGTYFDPAWLPNYAVTLDDFNAKYDTTSKGNQAGKPRSFTAKVTTRDDGKQEKQVLKVNDPLHLGGANLYLLGNGYAPVVTVKDGKGHTVYSGPTVFLPQNGNNVSRGVVKAPDAVPKQMGFVGVFFPTAGQDKKTGRATSLFPGLGNPVLVFSGYYGDLGLDDGTAQSVYSLDPTDMTAMTDSDGKPASIELKPGDEKKLPNGMGSVKFDGVKRFASIDIRHDPTKVYVLAFALLGLVGLAGSLFIPRRRIWIRVRRDDDDKNCRVEVAGLARGEDNRLETEVDDVADRLMRAQDSGRTGSPAPDGESQ